MKITLRKKPEPIYIASFDIGIKNLAFCILSYDPNRSDGSRFPIQDWQNLNLIPNNETKYCQQIIQSGNRIGQPCGHQAYNITTNQIPLCKRHTNTLLKNIDDDTSKSLCDASAPDGFSKSLCDTSAPDGFSKSLCDSPEINSTSEEENTSEHNQNVEIIRYRQVANMTTQEINEILVKTLDQFPTLLKCQTIVLQHQPSKNPKMKNLSNMLYSYFVIRGIVDRPEGHLKKILFAGITGGIHLDFSHLSEELLSGLRDIAQWMFDRCTDRFITVPKLIDLFYIDSLTRGIAPSLYNINHCEQLEIFLQNRNNLLLSAWMIMQIRKLV